jgi:hypothetical protein
MQLRQSERKQARIKMALQGPAGSGKTMSALLLAFGITNNWAKIAVVDTETGSADLYAHLGNYNVISMQPQYSPENYVKAIGICENAAMEVIILDSISHCWEYLLDYHSNLAGNSFQNWNKVNPRQKEFVDKILQSPCHIISTMRVKQDYVLNLKDGKYVPEKVGLKSVMRDGVEYEFSIVLDLDIKHNAIASKDRTGLFADKPEFKINQDTGKAILAWCHAAISVEDIRKQIQAAMTLDELTIIYRAYPTWFSQLQPDFNLRKQQLTHRPTSANIIYPQRPTQNGTSSSSGSHPTN